MAAAPPPGTVEARTWTRPRPPVQPKVISAVCLRMPEGTCVKVMAASGAQRPRMSVARNRSLVIMSVTVLHAGFEKRHREGHQGNGGGEIRPQGEVIAHVHGGQERQRLRAVGRGFGKHVALGHGVEDFPQLVCTDTAPSQGRFTLMSWITLLLRVVKVSLVGFILEGSMILSPEKSRDGSTLYSQLMDPFRNMVSAMLSMASAPKCLANCQ